MLKHPLDNNKKIRLGLIALLLVIVGMVFYEKLFVFLIIMIFSGVVQYLTHRQQLKFNLGHVFFLGLITVKEIGVIYGIFLVIFGEFFPKVLSGDMEARSLLSLPLSIGLMLVFSFLSDYPFTLVAILLTVINYSILFILSKYSGESAPEKIMEIGLPFFLNIIYIFSVSSPLISILGKVIAV